METIGGTAKADKVYKPIKQTIVFEKDKNYKFLDIDLINNLINI